MTEEFRKFLKNLYDRLYKEGIITKSASTSKEKLEIILAYIDKIARVQNKAEENKEYLRRIKELYYKRYIIKESEIPNSYFEHLSKRYKEEGHGDLDLINSKTDLEKEVRRMHVEEIIHTEKSSIDAWLDYLMSSESDHIPTWAKVWAFTGMLDIGVMNQETESFNRRRNGTIAPFVNINSEILGKSVEYLKMHLGLIPNKFFPDEETKRLASTENFYQIYGKLLSRSIAINPTTNEGIWLKYNASSKEDALRLYESLQGYNTGWCTAASKETAINQVCGGGSYPGGDFYVYYSKDVKSEYKIPRLAIRMDKEKIGEIRGIARNQNIEPEMTEILDLKLNEFPDSQEYLKKVSDMKILTSIYNKHQQKQELTKEDLIFLYEIENRIEGFGYQKDPRIAEILNKRNQSIDIAHIFDGIEKITGNVYLSNITHLKNVKFPKYIEGDLYLEILTSAEDLILPENIGGFLVLSNLTTAEGLVLPKIVRSLSLDSLTINDLLEVTLPKRVNEIFLEDGEYSLKELQNLIAIRKEKLDLETQKNIIDSNPSIVDDNPRKGNINIWYILIPSLTLLLGIIIASIIYNF